MNIIEMSERMEQLKQETISTLTKSDVIVLKAIPKVISPILRDRNGKLFFDKYQAMRFERWLEDEVISNKPLDYERIYEELGHNESYFINL